MTIEILSLSNTALETARKLNLYRDAGVREYWLVDPERRCIEAYRLYKGRYLLDTFRDRDTVCSETLPGLAIPLDMVFT